MSKRSVRFIVLTDIVVAHVTALVLCLMPIHSVGKLSAAMAVAALDFGFIFQMPELFCSSFFILLPAMMFCLPESYFVSPVFWFLLFLIPFTATAEGREGEAIFQGRRKPRFFLEKPDRDC